MVQTIVIPSQSHYNGITLEITRLAHQDIPGFGIYPLVSFGKWVIYSVAFFQMVIFHSQLQQFAIKKNATDAMEKMVIFHDFLIDFP